MQIKCDMKYYKGTAELSFHTYANSGTAITLESKGGPVATATVWVPGLKVGEVAIKDYSENEGMFRTLYNAGVIGTPHRYVRTGYEEVPVCKLLVKPANSQ